LSKKAASCKPFACVLGDSSYICPWLSLVLATVADRSGAAESRRGDAVAIVGGIEGDAMDPADGLVIAVLLAPPLTPPNPSGVTGGSA